MQVRDGGSLGQLRALVLAAMRDEDGGDLGPAVRCFLLRREKEAGKGPLAKQSLYRVLLFLATRTAASVKPKTVGSRWGRAMSGSGCRSGGGGGLLGTVAGASGASASVSAECQDRCGSSSVSGGGGGGGGSKQQHPNHHRVLVKGGFDRAFARACEEMGPEERRLLRPDDVGPRDLALASRSVFGHLY
jgi:hypothetical protein